MAIRGRHGFEGILTDHNFDVSGDVSVEGLLRLNESAVRDILRQDLAAKRLVFYILLVIFL